jgi:hypothetical protein
MYLTQCHKRAEDQWRLYCPELVVTGAVNMDYGRDLITARTHFVSAVEVTWTWIRRSMHDIGSSVTSGIATYLW